MVSANERYDLFKIWINKYSHQLFPNIFEKVVSKPTTSTIFGIQTFHHKVILSLLVVLVLVSIIVAAKKRRSRQLEKLENLYEEVCTMMTETMMQVNMLRGPIQEGISHYPLWQLGERILLISRSMDAMHVMLDEIESNVIFNLFHN